jgi:hypothetical protein
MKKEFVPYELSVKLKALGFDEPCIAFYLEKVLTFHTHGIDPHFIFKKNSNLWYSSSAPLYQQAFRWFRENHFYISYVCAPYKEHDEFYFRIRHIGDVLNEGQLESCESRMYNTYEEAELVCLTKLIEIVEQKEK